MLADGFCTRRVYAACCGVALVADHPAYAASRVVTYADGGATVELLAPPAAPALAPARAPAAAPPPPSLRAPDGRIFVGDLEEAEAAALPPFVAPAAGARSWQEGTRAAEAALRALPVQAAPHWGLGLRGPFDELFCGLGEVEVQAPEHAGPTPEWLRRAGVAS